MKFTFFLLALLTLSSLNFGLSQSDTNNIELNIFPNPNRGNFYITLVNHDACRSQLYGMDGRLVKTIYLQRGLNYISIEAPPGLYIMRVGIDKEVSSYKIEIK